MTHSDHWFTIPQMLDRNASTFGSRAAILGEEGLPLTHRELQIQVAATVQSLSTLGITQADRVAFALPQGPDLAVAFLSVAACATAAPLNPAYLQNEFRLQLQDLPAKALILPRGSDSPARTAADELGIPVMELIPSAEVSGRFELTGPMRAKQSGPAAATPDDIALMLHTSGTTSRPKRVPLSHANLCSSARNIAATLQLQPDDISLAIMPLFHIHGLMACVLAALSAGGSCVCVRSFQPNQFPLWLERWKPTWFSAVPTMHQAILDCARDTSLPAHSLRFIRSSSAALPPPVMAHLEELFGVPVIESYGMTEAAHQMASNPLPPRARKPGSVGLPAGPRIAILDPAGNILASGSRGEVAIMGPNVTRGYENNPEANASAFCNGWFRTGDQGYLDEDGYLFITGRLKEMINRGGEKIIPREIDEALLAHPAIRQAVAFAVPHPSLGEDIAAAVVLRAGASASEAELRVFLLDSLPAFKVPSRIVLLDDLPKGPTGKIQRIGMADRLAESLKIAFEPPVSDMEKLVAAAICEVLGLERAGRHDNFFAAGGDSLRAMQVIVRLSEALSLELPPPLLFRLPTPALLAARLDELVSSRDLESIEAGIAALPPGERARLLAELGLAP
jgi:acyl-CoA synthetase (AMP-forming)/AMP-acid ligase II/acyl carrier protein